MARGESPDDIERDMEARREDLAQTLERLQDKVAPERLVQHAAHALQDEGAILARAVLRRAGANPVATAMVAAGLAWLIFGPDERALRPAPARTRGLRSAPPAPAVERRRSRPPRGPVPAGRPAPQAARTGEVGERRAPTHDVRGAPVAVAAPSQGQ
jgi:hypothetical protein